MGPCSLDKTGVSTEADERKAGKRKKRLAVGRLHLAGARASCDLGPGAAWRHLAGGGPAAASGARARACSSGRPGWGPARTVLRLLQLWGVGLEPVHFSALWDEPVVPPARTWDRSGLNNTVTNQHL